MAPRKHHHKLTDSVRKAIARMEPLGHRPIAIYREIVSIHGSGSISKGTVNELFNEFKEEQAIQTDNGYGPGKNTRPHRQVDKVIVQEEMEIESDLRADFEVMPQPNRFSTNVVNAQDVNFTIPGEILALADKGANVHISWNNDYTISIERKENS